MYILTAAKYIILLNYVGNLLELYLIFRNVNL